MGTASKAIGAGIGGALATLFVFILGQFGVEVSAEAAGALGTLLGVIVTYFAPANTPST